MSDEYEKWKAESWPKDHVYETILTFDIGAGVKIEIIRQENSRLTELDLQACLKQLCEETAIAEIRPGVYQPL